MRRSRYAGEAKTHLQHLATAAALNVLRIGDWLAEKPREQTRTSAFARLMTPLATAA
jgi:transposase